MAATNEFSLKLNLPLPNRFDCYPPNPLQGLKALDFPLTPKTEKVIYVVRQQKLEGIFTEGSRMVLNVPSFTLIYPSEGEDPIGFGSYKLVYVGVIINARDQAQRVIIAVPRQMGEPGFFEEQACRLRAMNAEHLLKDTILIALDEKEYAVEPYFEGDFYDYIQNHCNDQNFSKQIFEYFLCVAKDLKERFHDRGFLHRDIKPTNILVGPGVKLGDYDFVIREGDYSYFPFDGVSRYFDPQVCDPKSSHYGKPSKATDIYALGMTLKRLLDESLEKVSVDDHTYMMRELVEPMLSVDHKERLTIDGVIEKMEAFLIFCDMELEELVDILGESTDEEPMDLEP